MARNKEAPEWLVAVKQATRIKMEHSPLTQGCAQGRIASLRALLVGFAPFVYSFPEMIKSKYDESGDRKARILADMEQDERGHNALWRQACTALAISEKQLEREPLPRMCHLINIIGEDTDAWRTWLRFLAVEIIAEALSKALMPHAAFRERVGKQVQDWFTVHLDAKNEATAASHETLTIRLAQRDAGRSVASTQLASEATHAIDLFISAGEECYTQLAIAAS